MFKGFLISFCVVVFRYFLSVRKGFPFKWHVLVIVFMVLQPYLVEATQQNEWQIAPELVNSVFESREFVFQDGNNIARLSGPFSWGGIKPFKLSSNSLLEFSRSNKISNPHIAEQTYDNAAQATNSPNRPIGEQENVINKICHELFIIIRNGLIIGILLLLLDYILTQQLLCELSYFSKTV